MQVLTVGVSSISPYTLLLIEKEGDDVLYCCVELASRSGQVIGAEMQRMTSCCIELAEMPGHREQRVERATLGRRWPD